MPVETEKTLLPITKLVGLASVAANQVELDAGERLKLRVIVGSNPNIPSLAHGVIELKPPLHVIVFDAYLIRTD